MEEHRAVDLSVGMTRRELMRRGAAAGISLPTLAMLIAACGGDDDGGAASSVATAADTGAGGGGDAGPLKFTAWEAYPDQIKANLANFTKASGVDVDLTLIPNIGYGPAIQTRLQGGERIDAYYNFGYNSSKFIDAGWAKQLNDLEGVDDMLADMFPSAVERHKLPDGRIVSVPYFSAVHLLHYNKEHLSANGISAPPTTKEEVYEQSKKLKAAGITGPYAAYWTKQFVEEYFTLYLVAEGVTPFDDKGAPVFQDDAKTEGVFEWMKTMYDEELTPKTILTDDPGKHVVSMQQGNSTFYVLHHYFLQIIRSGEGPQAANIDLSYKMPGASGKSLQIGEVVQLGAKASGADADAAWELLKFYGWKDQEGKYGTFTSWAKAAALLGPYPGLFEDADFKAAFPAYFDQEALQEAFTSAEVVPTRVLPWYSGFATKVGDRMHAMILGQSSVKDTISALADDARSAAGT